MASPATVFEQAAESKKASRQKVTWLRADEGGIQLAPFGTHNVLPPGGGGGYTTVNIPGLEMELDRSLDAVVIRWNNQKQTKTTYVKLVRLKQWDVAE